MLKKEGRQGGAKDSPQRRNTCSDVDSDSTPLGATPRKIVSASATRVITRSAEKTSDLSPSGIDVNTQQIRTFNEVMQLLLQEKARAERREREGKREGTTIWRRNQAVTKHSHNTSPRPQGLLGVRTNLGSNAVVRTSRDNRVVHQRSCTSS